MKKLCCLFLCAFLILSFVPSRAAGVTPVMRVVKCSEWVSLRATPSTKSDRLAKVYLGELVTECSASTDGFIYCNYNGKYGYILYEYLTMTDFPAYAGVLPNQMVVNCTDWVSLRSGPYESASRLRTVPLGAIVVACVQEDPKYVSCEYQGVRGYILASYLKKANYTASKMDTNVVTKADGKYPAITGPMTVVNCTDWVSLREKASANSARLARVPLGDKVDNCVQVDDRFVYCSYKNLWGYIDIQYLQGENTGGNPFDRLSGSPTRAEFDAAGDSILEFSVNGMTVEVRHAMAGDAEYMCAMFFDAYGVNLGRLDAVNQGSTELTALQAFKGGTESDPRLIWLTREALSSYGVDKTHGGMSLRWTLDMRSTWWSVGSSARFAADKDGTLYLCGYKTAPVCISHNGIPMWRAENDDPNIYWPISIKITSYGIDVTYDGGGRGAGGEPTVLSFDRNGHPAVKSGWQQYLTLRESMDPENEAVDYTYATEMDDDGALIVITCVAPGGISDFTILSTEGTELDSSGTLLVQTHEMMTLARLDKDETVGARLIFDGIIPMNALSFRDSSGAYHRYMLDFSGEDGSLMLMEF